MKAPMSLVAGICCVLLAINIHATVRYVNVNNLNPALPYVDWDSAATNIQDAIDVSVAGDFVVVSNGVYNVGGRAVYGSVTNRVTIDKPVSVQSVNGPAFTIIAGFANNSIPPDGIRCAYLTSGATLAGFTLTNGAGWHSGDAILEKSGAGVWCEDLTAVVSNCVLVRNVAAYSGGGAFRGTLINCTLTNNSAGFGGGAASNLLINCTVINNMASQQNFNSGGGAFGCVLSNCWVIGNTCIGGRGGGGAYDSTLIGCLVSNNFANSLDGGGLCLGFAENCLISSNRASRYGGGACSNVMNNCIITLNRATTAGAGTYYSALINCTVVSNTAGNGVTSGSGGGIFAGGATNCIVYYNAAEGGRNFAGSILRYSDSFPLAPGLGNISNAPVFVDLVNGDFHLQSNSPCINSGNNSFVTSGNDFDGNARFTGHTVDMGAFEFQSPASIVSYAYLQQYGLPTDGSADSLDSDGDGFNNSQEWVAGTNPTNSASLLEMEVPNPGASGVTIVWQSVTNIIYFIQRSEDLSAPFATIQNDIIGQTGTTSYTDLAATNTVPYFYRVGVLSIGAQ